MAVFEFFSAENPDSAIAASGAVNKILPGGDKSVTHRALIFAALAEGESVISNPSRAFDCLSTAAALDMLGASCRYDRRANAITVTGRCGDFREPAGAIDCGNSGTTARLLMGALAGAPGSFFLSGDASLVERPMNRIAMPLAEMGAKVILRSGGRLPAAVEGAALRGAKFVNSRASAQVKAALIFAGMRASGRTVIAEPFLTRDHSERMAGRFGIEVRSRSGRDGVVRVTVPGRQTASPASLAVPGDPSTAAFYITLDALFQAVRSRRLNILIPSVMVNETRNGYFERLFDAGFDMLFTRFDDREFVETAADLSVHYGGYSPVAPLRIDSPAEIVSMIDEIPLLALVLSFARGESFIGGLSELRVKETDRLSAIADGLNAMGARISVKGDALVIGGVKKLHGAALDARGDHRIAMTLIIAGLVAGRDFSVAGCECVAVSNPSFFRDLKKLGFRFRVSDGRRPA